MKIWSLIKLIPVIPFPQMHKTSGTSDAKSETCQNGYFKKKISLTLNAYMMDILFKRSCYLPSRIKNNKKTI